MGAKWANTLRLGPELFPNRDAWLTVAFEASPLIQPYVEQYAAFLNGERLDPPLTCLPRSGSTPHLRRYASAIGCVRKNDDAMRMCFYATMARHLSALRPDARLNSSTLIGVRLDGAVRLLNATCPKGCHDRVVAVPAAVGTRAGWLPMWGSPRQLIRGGAKPAALVPEQTHGLFDVRVVDVVAWLARAAPRARFVFLKIDVEGAEHAIVERMHATGVHRFVNAVALECHDIKGQCKATTRRLAQWNVTVIHETAYHGMDAMTASDTSIPQTCLPERLRRKLRRRGKDACKPAQLPPRTFATCAVVGSAPSMAHLYQGDAIDRHAAVFRTNAHIDVETVGRKTTFRVAANAFQLGKHRALPAEGVVQLLPPNSRAITPGNLVTDKDVVQCVSVRIIDDIYKDVGIRFGEQMLSTGAMALGIALHSCRSVTIFGFGGLQSYDRVLRDKHHAWVEELVWIRGLISSGRVVDATDRGLHVRKCEAAMLVRDTAKMLKGQSEKAVARAVSVPAQQLLQEAAQQVEVACPPVAGVVRRWLSGSVTDSSAVDNALLEFYKRAGA